jgi:nucleoside-diphosphate-sugar epimerase
MVRRPDQPVLVRADGGEPFVGDVAQAALVRTAAAGCDAIIHLAAPSRADPASVAGRREFDRSRVRGAQNLLGAAVELGIPRLIVGSGYWLYGPHKGTITERSRSSNPTPVAHNLGAERIAKGRPAGTLPEVIVARPGMVYGDGAWFRPFAQSIQAGTYRFVGAGSNHWSPVSLPDCGRAFATLVRRGRGGETYLVVDDEPVPVRALAEFVAQQLGVPPPRGMSFAVAAEAVGAGVASALSANQAASNAKLRALGWRPQFPTIRDGLPKLLGEMARSGSLR